MNVLSLFSGIGGLELGLGRRGSPPSAEYLAVRAALQERTEEETP